MLVCISCGKLSRSEAKKKIEAFDEQRTDKGFCCWEEIPTFLPSSTEGADLNCFCVYYNDNRFVDKKKRKIITDLCVLGYLQIDTAVEYIGCCKISKYIVKPAPQHADLIMESQQKQSDKSQRLKLVEMEVDEITGITQQENMAVVYYTRRVKGKKTVFGEIYEGDDCGCLQPKYTATFQKFDEGWRIISN